MPKRKLTEVISDLNDALSIGLSYQNIDFYNLCKKQEKDGAMLILSRDGRDVSGKLANLSKRNKGIIYHRIIDEAVDKRPSKGRESIQFIRTTVRLIGWIKRPDIRTQPNWDDQELMNEALFVVNSNDFLARRETVKVVNASSDFIEIMEEEIGKENINKKLTYELTMFYVDYEVQQLQKCVF